MGRFGGLKPRVRQLGRARWVCGAVGLLLAAGCEPPREVKQQQALLKTPSHAEQVKLHRESTRLFNEEGELEASDESVLGVQLPRGLAQRSPQLERRWIYDTRVPIDKLHKYFGPRLATANVVPGGGTVTYKRVRAELDRGEVFFDVIIGASPGNPGRSFVDFREHLPTPTEWPSDEEVQRRIAEMAKRAH